MGTLAQQENKNFFLKKDVAALLLIAFTVWAILLHKYAGRHALGVLFFVSWFFLFINKQRSLTKAEKIFSGFSATVFFHVLFSIGMNGWHEYAFSNIDMYAKYLIPLPLLLMLARIKFKKEFLWWIVCISSIIVGVGALLGLFLGAGDRYYFHGQPTLYGNLALICGALSLLAIPYFKEKKMQIIPIAASVLGVSASLCSQSRGGWIALPVIIVLLVWFYRTPVRKLVSISAVSLIVLWVFLFLGPGDLVKSRVLQAGIETQSYFQDSDEHGGEAPKNLGSVGLRFELWKAAWLGIKERPVLGVGVGEFLQWKNKLVANNLVHPQLGNYLKHVHNEYLEILFGRGLVGFLFMMFFIGWLVHYFYNATIDRESTFAPLGLAGLLVIVSYLVYSLTESFFSTHLGAGFFVVMVSILMHLIETERIENEAGEENAA